MKTYFIPDVIVEKISDHRPLVHHDILFWNIMKKTCGNDNGFGMFENSDNVYQKRLMWIACVLASIIYQQPNIHVIGICEGPIQFNDQMIFLKTLLHFPWMQKFSNKLYQPHKPTHSKAPEWGLFLLADKKFQVTKINTPSTPSILINRFQLFCLTHQTKTQYIAITHFPLISDALRREAKKLNLKEDARVNALQTDAKKLNPNGHYFSNFINHYLHEYQNQEFYCCGDFNLNPYLINSSRYLDRVPTHNSVMQINAAEKFCTVDGILLSAQAKQMRFRFFPNLKKEHELSLIADLEKRPKNPIKNPLTKSHALNVFQKSWY